MAGLDLPPTQLSRTRRRRPMRARARASKSAPSLFSDGRRMYVGTQIRPRDDSDYRVWAQLGVRHVCVDPPGNPHRWSIDDLLRQREHVEKFGLTLDMVQLPMSSAPLEQQDSLHILLGQEPERRREIDSICRLIERIGAAGIPATKYNLNILGIPRTASEPGRGGSRNA